MKEKMKVNKSLLIGWAVLVVVLLLAYTVEFIKGERTLIYYIVFILLDIVPFIVTFLLYRQNNESSILQYITAFGYSGLYVFVLLTGDTPMVFVYILPMLSLLLLCTNMNLLLGLTGISLLSNITIIVYRVVALKMTTADDIANYEIEILATALCMAYTILGTKVLTDINNYKLNTIKEKEEKQKEMLVAIQGAVVDVTEKAGLITSSMEQITESATSTSFAMQEVADSSLQTAESIQEQLLKTSEIQDYIVDAVALTDDILKLSQDANTAVQSGISHMSELNEGVSITKSNSEIVTQKTVKLQEKAHQASDIISIISDVATQTNLLALNAAIEAARAGVAGRGFSVVADEINNLSLKTKEATQEIAKLIEELSSEVNSVAKAIDEMNKTTQKQNETIKETSSNFDVIKESVSSVSDKVAVQEKRMQDITVANEKIVDSINTISATSEEVTAGSQQTLDVTESNKEVIEKVNADVRALKDKMEELTKL